jgi:predicted glycogen debranching enzyme
MDARVDGVPVTARAGKPVEVNALWISGLARIGRLLRRLGRDPETLERIEGRARAAFRVAFPLPDGSLRDVIDGPEGDDPTLRPNQLLAVSLPEAPITDERVVRACAPLLTSLGLRSLAPDDPRYLGRHRGAPAERDRAYHQGTVWPWLIGPYVEAAVRTGVPVDGVLDGLELHRDPPHAVTGCPFQAWSVAELIRARRLLSR